VAHGHQFVDAFAAIRKANKSNTDSSFAELEQVIIALLLESLITRYNLISVASAVSLHCYAELCAGG
jgi:hypothetical protein